MIYYQVTLKDGNTTKALFSKYKRMILVDKELFTTRELNQIKQQNYCNYTDDDFTKIEWNKQKTFFMFGVRHQSKK